MMNTYTLPIPRDFLSNHKGKNTHLFILTNKRGMQVSLTDYGARIVSVLVPDRQGKLIDVVLGFGDIKSYMDAQEQFHGATIGRYANRIANAGFELEGHYHQLEENNGSNCLHSGSSGFHNKVWDRRVSLNKQIDFYYESFDGEGGFPGVLKTLVSYELTDENSLVIKFRAVTSKPTVFNPTNHAYFNLKGEGQGDVLDHYLKLNSGEFLPLTKQQVPQGDFQKVKESAFDFEDFKRFDEGLKKGGEQLELAGGYDHSFKLDGSLDRAAAVAYSEESGVQLSLYTDMPSVHLYTGNFLADDRGKLGQKYLTNGGFCLEAQFYPDSPNQKHFPSVKLTPEQVFQKTIIYNFGIKK